MTDAKELLRLVEAVPDAVDNIHGGRNTRWCGADGLCDRCHATRALGNALLGSPLVLEHLKTTLDRSDLQVKLSIEEVLLITEALDTHLYEGLAEEGERNSGFAYFPAEGDQKFKDGDEEDQSRWLMMAKTEDLTDRLSGLARRHLIALRDDEAAKTT